VLSADESLSEGAGAYSVQGPGGKENGGGAGEEAGSGTVR